MQGLATAASSGKKHWGRAPSLTPEQVRQARAMIDSGTSVSETAEILGTSRASIYRGFDREHVSHRHLMAELAKYRSAVEAAQQAFDQVLSGSVP